RPREENTPSLRGEGDAGAPAKKKTQHRDGQKEGQPHLQGQELSAEKVSPATRGRQRGRGPRRARSDAKSREREEREPEEARVCRPQTRRPLVHAAPTQRRRGPPILERRV